MENNFQSILGGRVALSARCEGRIETAKCNPTKNILKLVGFDTGSALLDQRSSL